MRDFLEANAANADCPLLVGKHPATYRDIACLDGTARNHLGALAGARVGYRFRPCAFSIAALRELERQNADVFLIDAAASNEVANQLAVQLGLAAIVTDSLLDV